MAPTAGSPRPPKRSRGSFAPDPSLFDDGVDSVTVDLVAAGTSSVTVASAERLDDARVAAALDEAGDYHLAS